MALGAAMKGVILAGGRGTRLWPLTDVTNKHLLPIYNKPMVFYPIQTLVRAGIRDLLIVIGGPHAGHFVSVLRNSRHWGVQHLEFAYQEQEGGIAQALALAEDFADRGSVVVILGDNTTDADLSPAVASFAGGATIFIKRVPDPERFGVPTFDRRDASRIVAITEKPTAPASPYAVTGLYLYDAQVFEIIRGLVPSARGELEITDINTRYLDCGQLSWRELDGYWRDVGTFETLLEANNYWAAKLRADNGDG